MPTKNGRQSRKCHLCNGTGILGLDFDRNGNPVNDNCDACQSYGRVCKCGGYYIKTDSNKLPYKCVTCGVGVYTPIQLITKTKVRGLLK